MLARVAANLSVAVRQFVAADRDRKTIPDVEAAWDYILVRDAIGATEMTPFEERLLLRLAEARGQRVALGELARDFALPKSVAIEHDFPALTAYCAERPAERPLPIIAGGSGDDAWYRMPLWLGVWFESALIPAATQR
jgi:hypothetical protein